MKRAFIFGFLEFPHGSASANYVQYLALALRECGYESYVISSGDTKQCIWNESLRCYTYEKLNFVPYNLSTNKILHYLQFRYGLGKIVVKELKKFECNSSDIVVAYSLKPSEMEPAFKFAKKNNIQSVACVTELFPPEFFKGGVKGKGWKEYKRVLEHSIKMADKVWPISSYIEEYFKKFNCDMLIIPPLVDTKAVEYKGKKAYRNKKEINIVFSGNRKIKDALIPMAEAVNSLNSKSVRKIRLHITGVSKSYFKDNENLLKCIGDSIILYDWMSYDELQSMYSNMDFLFLAREKTQLTMANFPSKVPEVMAHGIVPIASKVGDYTDKYLKDSHNSILFEGATIESCTEVLQRVINLSDENIQRLSFNARTLAEEAFDYRRWSKKILAHLTNS